MIDKSKLEALPAEALFKLKAAIDEVAEKRKRQLFKTGAAATFTHSTTGEKMRVIVMRVHTKNISCVEADAHGMPLYNKKWRIDPAFLMPYFAPKKPTMPAAGVGNDRPAQIAAW